MMAVCSDTQIYDQRSTDKVCSDVQWAVQILLCFLGLLYTKYLPVKAEV